MKTWLLIALLLWPVSEALAQMAVFTTDTSRIRISRKNEKAQQRISEMKWVINGQLLQFGPGRVEVRPDEIPDTILYQQHEGRKWDTIICTIKRAGTYAFHYNECCGAFNIAEVINGKSNFIPGTVLFKVHGSAAEKIFLGTLGEAGILVNRKKSDTLKVGCRSAMSPNIYPLTFGEIQTCADTTGCQGTCLQQKESDPIYDYSYKPVEKKLDILWMPLEKTPLIVTYDARTGELKIE